MSGHTVRGLVLLCSVSASTVHAAGATSADGADPRLREVIYDPAAVVTVPVKRGVVTLVVLDAGEVIVP